MTNQVEEKRIGITIRMSKIFHRRLKTAAHRKDMSISQFIRTSVITKIESED